jgi:hypothetical protein
MERTLTILNQLSENISGIIHAFPTVRTRKGVKILDSRCVLLGASSSFSLCLFATGPSRPVWVKEEGILGDAETRSDGVTGYKVMMSSGTFS